MKISDFKLTEVIGSSPLSWRFRASVTVTIDRFFRKPIIEEREVYKSYAGQWYFSDNGSSTPSKVADLSRALEARQGKDLPYCTTV